MTTSDLNQRPWGIWHTLVLGLAILFALVLIEILVSTAYVMTQIPASLMSDPKAYEEAATEVTQKLENNGLFLSIIVTVRMLFGVALVFLVCYLRKGISIPSYLGLHAFSLRNLMLGLLIVIAYLVAMEMLFSALHRDTVPEFMRESYATATYPVLLWLSIILFGPLFEEIFFRGFLYAGLTQSRLGISGSILLTSLLWALIHMQYEWPEMLVVFGLGVLLGYLRWRSGSLYLVITLHALNNLFATIEVAQLQQNLPAIVQISGI